MNVWHVFLLRNTETWRRFIESSSSIFFHYNITQSFENRFTILLKVFKYCIILSYLYLIWRLIFENLLLMFNFSALFTKCYMSPHDPSAHPKVTKALVTFTNPEILFRRSAKSWMMEAMELLHWHKSTAAPTVIVTGHSQPLLLQWCCCIRWNHPQATVDPQIAANSIF